MLRRTARTLVRGRFTSPQDFTSPPDAATDAATPSAAAPLPWISNADSARAPPIPRSNRAQAQHFSTLKGLEPGADPRFDAFVADKRKAAEFEEFDQRVERAYLEALKGHKAEIWNAVKRRLTTGGGKYTPDVLMETNRTIEQRTRWLRDVFAQIDADYRSADPDRQSHAAKEITRALEGTPSEFMEHAYQRKADRRTKGPKSREVEDTELEGTLAPEVSEEEASRYVNLRPKFATIERAVKQRYGLAGARHWDALQAEKDAEYSEKLERAALKYKELLEQQEAYDEGRVNANHSRIIGRVHQGQVRFQTAIEMEEERLRIMEAKEEMDKERYEMVKQQRREALLQAATWRKEGVPEAEIAQRLKMETFDRILERQSDRAASAQARVIDKKRAFTTLIDELEARFEERDGRRAMEMQQANAESSSDAVAAGNVDDEIHAEMRKVLDEAERLATERANEGVRPDELAVDNKPAPKLRPATLEDTKMALWDVMNEDKWRDPFLVVHQARLDARATYSDLYAHTKPTNLRLGKKSKRGDSFNIGGGGNEHKVLQDPWLEYQSYGWGLNRQIIHNLDEDPKKQYVTGQDGPAVKDPITGGIDFNYEKKAARGLRFDGPRFYKLGIDEDRAREQHPGEEPAAWN